MNNTQILEAAIKMATANGWSPVERDTQNCTLSHYFESKEYIIDIFSHDFAKAFFGEEEAIIPSEWGFVCFPRIWASGEEAPSIPEWQYRLQQMVISDDPIAYLKAFLK